MNDRELCWKPIGEYDNCDRWEGHSKRCLATCGDCKEGRCHISIRPPRPGVGDPTCGCARHADSLLALKWDEELPPEEQWPEELLNARVRFWMCPVEHPKRNDDKGWPLPTVEWRGDVAHCLDPGCGKTSAGETTEAGAKAVDQ